MKSSMTLLVIALALSACGNGDNQETPAAESSSDETQAGAGIASAPEPPPVTADLCGPIDKWTPGVGLQIDVGGVVLGMPAAAASAKLGDSGLIVSTGPFYVRSNSYFDTVTGRSANPSAAQMENVFAGHHQEVALNHILWISRYVDFVDPSVRPTVETALGALEKKYGKGTIVESDETVRRIEWGYTPAGQPLPANDPLLDTCSAGKLTAARNGLGHGQEAPNVSIQCGISVSAILGIGDGGAVKFMRTAALDARQLVACQMAKDALDETKRAAEDAAAAEKAKLAPPPSL